MSMPQEGRRETTALAKGAGIFLAGTIVGNGLRYVFQMVAARGLGPGAYGALLLGTSALQVLQLVADLGLSQGVSRFAAIFKGAGDAPRVKGVLLFALRTVLLTAPLLGTAALIAARPVAVGIFHNADLVPVLRFMAVTVPFYALETILAFGFQGLQIIKYRVYINQLIEPGVRVGLIVLFLLLGFGLTGALSAYAAGCLAALAAGLLLLRKACPEVYRRSVPAVRDRKAILAFSGPMMGTYLMSYLLVWNDAFFLGALRSAREVGLYGAAQRTAMLLTFILASFAAIFGPLAADLLNRGKRDELEGHFRTVVHWSFSLTLPPAVLAALFARPLLRLFGEPFTAAAASLAVLAAAWTLHALLGLCGTVVSMSGRSKLQLANNAFLLAVNVGLLIGLVPRFGMMGAAAATAGGVTLYGLVTWIEVRLILKLNPLRPDILKPVAAAGLAAGALVLLGPAGRGASSLVRMGAGSALFLLIYAGSLLALGIRDEDKVVLARVLSKLKLWDQPGSEWAR